MVDTKTSFLSEKIIEIIEIIESATKNQERLITFKARLDNVLILINRLDTLWSYGQVPQQYSQRLQDTCALIAQMKGSIMQISRRSGLDRIYGREDVQTYGEELTQAFQILGEVFHNISFIVAEIEGEQSIQNQREIEEEQKQQFGRLQIEIQQAQQKLQEFFENIEKLTQEDDFERQQKEQFEKSHEQIGQKQIDEHFYEWVTDEQAQQFCLYFVDIKTKGAVSFGVFFSCFKAYVSSKQNLKMIESFPTGLYQVISEEFKLQKSNKINLQEINEFFIKK